MKRKSMAAFSIILLIILLPLFFLCIHMAKNSPIGFLTTGLFPQKTLNKFRALPHPYKDKVVIITFHDVSSTDKTKFAISPPQFETEILDLLKNGYHIIPLARAIDFSQHNGTVPSNSVVITSDDGYEGMYSWVYPVLKKYKIPATFFLVAGTIGHSPDCLTWNQVREMDKSGLVTFGGHTFHAHVPRLVNSKVMEPATIGHIYNPATGTTESSADFKKRMLKDSLAAQKLFLLKLGHTSPYFAYPYGAYTHELDRVLKAAGYKYFFTEIPGIISRQRGVKHFSRLDIGIPSISPTKMINDIYQWCSLLSPRKYMPNRYIIRWPAKNVPARIGYNSSTIR